MAAEVGEALVRVAGETGVMAPTLDARVSTGLTRPDYFDWPAHLVNIVETQAPEVMVVMFGANDAQRMKLDGVVYDVFDTRMAGRIPPTGRGSDGLPLS